MATLKAIWKTKEGYYNAIIDLGQTEIFMKEDQFIPPGKLTPPSWAELIVPPKERFSVKTEERLNYRKLDDIENPMKGITSPYKKCEDKKVEV